MDDHSHQSSKMTPYDYIRAYRQAAQLGFTIEPATRVSVIRQLASLLGQVAAERVQVELGYLLKSSQGTPWLTAAWEDNLLQAWFPDSTAQGLAKVAAIDHSVVDTRRNLVMSLGWNFEPQLVVSQPPC
jgi:tRNA nucleotidyltransferase (CCA-adding enzyme)